MSQAIQFTNIIFDLGDVLFKWSPETKTSISSRTLRGIISSPTWLSYERGHLVEEECYEQVGKEFNISPQEVRRAFDQARDSLVADDELLDLIRELKIQPNGCLRVFAMSNISPYDWTILQTKPADWSVFDQVFTSGSAGERKPDLGFYRHVLARTGVDPRQTIFVDDKLENVLSARSLGFHGIVFDGFEPVKRALRNLTGDPLARGQAFLHKNARNLVSVTDNGDDHEAILLQENFSQLLILEATGDANLVHLVKHPRTWNFFQDKGQLTTEEFPFDLDTTSLGLTVMKQDEAVANSVIDEMLEYVNHDGIIQTYFDHRRPRFDPVVCVNALTLFHTHGRGSELARTLQWIHEVLLNRAYLDGTRYYQTAECFLFFLSRLLASSGDQELHVLFKPLLKQRIQERVGAGGDSLALAMRILVCDFVGLRDEIDLRSLLPLQCEDGGWEIGWIYKYGSSGLRIGNRGLTTALALNALRAMSQSCEPTSTHTGTATLSNSSKCRSSLSSSGHARSNSLKKSLQWLWQAVGLGSQ